ncbi:MAG: ABC transporter ATP-binding protein [Faecalibacterium sp.]
MKSLFQLIGFVKPLTLQMLIAIFCGVMGHLFAISIPVLSVVAVLSAVGLAAYPVRMIFVLLACASLFRGVFAYFEQQRNHYIAFTILAIIRDKVCTVLRKLAPAKLDGKRRGDLIAMITSDIELLEVFFAHTISPVMIALFVAFLVAGVQYLFNPVFAVISLMAHILVGFILPICRGGKGAAVHADYRKQNGALSSYYLDALRGIDEVLQLQNGQAKIEDLQAKTRNLDALQKQRACLEGKNNALAETVVLFFGALMLIVSSMRSQEIVSIIIPTVMMMSSFGPFLSLSKLTVGLGGTIASADRVLALLQESPEVIENAAGAKPVFDGVHLQDVSFSYGETEILRNITMEIAQSKITSVIGKSGSGKSTLVKLMMRFWNSNGISIGGAPLDAIETKHLRALESYMTQDTDVFARTIMENIRIGDLNATDEQVIQAAKKASLHDFIMTLQDGYDTQVGELGDTLSGGERQRIGLARAFLHNGDLLVLDEPTSNLDSLNESIILNSIKSHGKATILISHRSSTLRISDASFELRNGHVVAET